MKDNPVLYRKRMIPEECVLLKDDKVLELTDDIIITKWNTLKPKRELHHGFSCYFLKHGFKVSKFYRADNSLMYWYCDIVDFRKIPTVLLLQTCLLMSLSILMDLPKFWIWMSWRLQPSGSYVIPLRLHLHYAMWTRCFALFTKINLIH